MRYAWAGITGVAAYAIALLTMLHLLHVRGDSAWYWLPFLASAAAVLAAARPWRVVAGDARRNAFAATAAVVVLVLVADLAGAVWYSCARGICL